MDIQIIKQRRGVVMELITQSAAAQTTDFPKDDVADGRNLYNGPSPYHVNYCGFEPCQPGYSFGPHSRTSNLLHMIFKGKGTYYVGEKAYRLSAGQIFLIYPGVTTTYQADFEDPWTYGWVGFSGYRSEFLISQMGFSPESPVVSVDDPGPLWTCIENIMETHQITYANELYRTAELLRLFAYIIEHHPKTKETSYLYSKSDYAQVAMRHLTQNYMKRIKIAELANYIGVDRSYLTKSFREEYHMSPQEFLIQLRMENASALLRASEEPVSVISKMVGYTDALAFSKIFKQRTGYSPSEYRRLESTDLPQDVLLSD